MLKGGVKFKKEKEEEGACLSREPLSDEVTLSSHNSTYLVLFLLCFVLWQSSSWISRKLLLSEWSWDGKRKRSLQKSWLILFLYILLPNCHLFLQLCKMFFTKISLYFVKDFEFFFTLWSHFHPVQSQFYSFRLRFHCFRWTRQKMCWILNLFTQHV